MTVLSPRERTFKVVAREGDEWWGIRVREFDWVFSQARHLHEVPEVARDAIAAYCGVSAGDIGEVVVDEVISAGTSFSPSIVPSAPVAT